MVCLFPVIGPAINPIINDGDEPLPSLSDWHDHEPNLEFDDTELTHPATTNGKYFYLKFHFFSFPSKKIFCVCWNCHQKICRLLSTNIGDDVLLCITLTFSLNVQKKWRSRVETIAHQIAKLLQWIYHFIFR